MDKQKQKEQNRKYKANKGLFRNANTKSGFFKTYISGGLRAFVVLIMLLAQFSIIIFLSIKAASYGVIIYYLTMLITGLIVIGLVNKNEIPSFKIGWLVVITIIPFAGLFMYILWGSDRSTKKIRARNFRYIEHSYKFIDNCDKELKELENEDINKAKMARYMVNNNFPLLKHNHVDYFSLGDEAFDAILEDLSNAEKFIFLDFFIVADGYLWQSMKKILLEKAKEGVEIKFLYDDYGSMFRTNKAFWKELNDVGIETAEFNPITKYLDRLYLNFRSHQKIVVIDGKVGYTGGINLADEYVNQLQRFGKWKDNAVRIEGNGVYGLSLVFLAMWGLATKKNIEDYKKYKYSFTEDELSELENNYVQIISDGPENNPLNPISEIIRQMIYNARDYLYITTPYLIPEEDMADALISAAQSGIDTRIVVPGIPDKKFVYLITKYNYGKLLKGGVRIYEYTPGFMHAKTYLTKDQGIVGTINLDYRSLYLHYECGAYLWDSSSVEDAKQDLINTFEESHEVTYEEWKKRPFIIKIIQPIANLFSSLL